MGIFSSLFRRQDKDPTIEHLLQNDMDDMASMQIEEPDDPDFRMAGMRLGIIYRDESGTATRRIIRLKRLDGSHHEGYLSAFCELRKEPRTFLLSRIQTMYDPATGEVLPHAIDFFSPYFDEREAQENARFERSKFRLAWNAIEALRDELQILILVARADGRFARVEQDVLLRYAVTRMLDMGARMSDGEQIVLRDWIKLQDPSEPEARLAIKALYSRQDDLNAVWEVSELIAEADGKYKPEERAAVSEIRSEIELVAAGRA